MMQPSSRIPLHRVASLDDLSAERSSLQFADLRSGDRVESIVALSFERADAQPKRVEPSGICRDIIEVAVEYRDPGRDVVDKPRDPFGRRRFHILAEAASHGKADQGCHAGSVCRCP